MNTFRDAYRLIFIISLFIISFLNVAEGDEFDGNDWNTICTDLHSHGTLNVEVSDGGDFGTVTVGTFHSKQLQISISVMGTVPDTQIKDIVIESSVAGGKDNIHFMLDEQTMFPMTIHNGDTETINIIYNPTMPSSPTHNVNVKFTASHNTLDGTCPHQPTVTVALEGTAVPIEMVLLLDISGSMHFNPDATTNHAPSGESRMDHVKDSLETFWTGLGTFAGGKGGMGLVVFPSETNALDPYSSTPYFLTNISTATTTISNALGIGVLDPHDHHYEGTPMTNGLEMAAGLFTDPNNKNVIFLLTDGAHNWPPEAVDPLELVDEESDPIRDNNIKIFALGYGNEGSDDVDLGLLNNLATATSGRYFGYDTGISPDQQVNSLGDLFEKILAEGLGLNLQMALDPSDKIGSGEMNEHKTYIIEYDKKTSFKCSWLTKNHDQLNFSIKAPDGTVVDPKLAKSSREISYHEGDTYKIYSIEPTYFTSSSKIGEWVLRIKANFSDSTLQEVYTYSVMMESRLKMDVIFDKEVCHTGDDVGVTAQILANGQAINNADVFVEVRRPEEGAGNWHHDNPVDILTLNKEVPPDFFPDRVSDTFRKGYYITNRLKIPPPSKKAPLPKVTLESIGKGLYKGTLSGEPDGTIKIGTYDFKIVAEGSTNSGNKFRREKFIQKYVSGKPSSNKTELKVEYEQDEEGFSIYTVKVTPRDKFGNYFGPRFSNKIELKSTSGELIGKIQDDLNGNYVQRLKVLSEGETPLVGAQISGLSMPSVRPDLAPSKTRQFGIFVYATAIFSLAAFICCIIILFTFYFKLYKK